MKKLQKQVLENGREFFEVWMFESNEEIQAVATAFGERFFLQAAVGALAHATAAKDLLREVIQLHMHTQVTDNLDFYLINGLISAEAARKLLAGKDAAVKRFVPFTNAAIDGLGNLPIQDLHAPIARNYVAFNAQKDMYNAESAGPMFDASKGATQASQRMARL